MSEIWKDMNFDLEHLLAHHLQRHLGAQDDQHDYVAVFCRKMQSRHAVLNNNNNNNNKF